MIWDLTENYPKKELVVILLLALVLLVLIYYRFVYLKAQQDILSYDTTDLQTEIMIEESRAARKAYMQDVIATGKENESGFVVPYNNLKNEMNVLNDIFSGISVYNFGFQQPFADGNAVRRNVVISFEAPDYSSARSIYNRIYGCQYRTLITNCAISPESGTSLDQGGVKASMSVIFFETLYGADSSAGILIPQTK